MMQRRQFVSLLAGAGIGARRLYGATDPCASNFSLLPDALQRPAAGKPFQLKWREPRLRPLWTELIRAGRLPAMAAKIQYAYRELARVSLRSAHSYSGLLGQAWFHKVYCTPLSTPANAWEEVHGYSAFLPWHRAFVYFHERLLQKILGEPEFRLPVWDWEASPAVPSAYNGWLQIPLADCGPIGHQDIPPFRPAEIQAWLASTKFSDFAGERYGGGLQAQTGSPHGAPHVLAGGFMSPLGVSALDPLFYSHHANIDRFWCAWWDMYQGKPGFTTDWPNDEFWYFYDPDQDAVVQVSAGQFMDTTLLGYYYQPPNLPLVPLTPIDAGTQGAPLTFSQKTLQFLAQFLENLATRAGIPVELPPFANQIVTMVEENAAKLLAVLPVQTLIAKILAQFPSFSLPVQVTFQPSGLQPGTYNRLGLQSNGKFYEIGSLTILDHDHRTDFVAGGGLSLASLSELWTELGKPGLSLAIRRGNEVLPAPKTVTLQLLFPNDKDLERFLGMV